MFLENFFGFTLPVLVFFRMGGLGTRGSKGPSHIKILNNEVRKLKRDRSRQT